MSKKIKVLERDYVDIFDYLPTGSSIIELDTSDIVSLMKVLEEDLFMVENLIVKIKKNDSQKIIEIERELVEAIVPLYKISDLEWNEQYEEMTNFINTLTNRQKIFLDELNTYYDDDLKKERYCFRNVEIDVLLDVIRLIRAIDCFDNDYEDPLRNFIIELIIRSGNDSIEDVNIEFITD